MTLKYLRYIAPLYLVATTTAIASTGQINCQIDTEKSLLGNESHYTENYQFDITKSGNARHNIRTTYAFEGHNGKDSWDDEWKYAPVEFNVQQTATHFVGEFKLQREGGHAHQYRLTYPINGSDTKLDGRTFDVDPWRNMLDIQDESETYTYLAKGHCEYIPN